MEQDKDLLIFDDDTPRSKSTPETDGTWRVLLADDEPEVHAVSRLALKNFSFANRTLAIYSAASAAEARAMLSEGPPFALALIDAVMESDQAGLELVRWIREELGDHQIRLVLRTGQPGQAPEREVISTYDINDYKEKTELTANKLHTLMYACLRSYRDIVALHRNKTGLEQIVQASSRIFVHQSLSEFVQGALQQLCALLHIDTGAFYSDVNSLAAVRGDNTNRIVAATGRFTGLLDHRVDEVLESVPIARDLVAQLMDEGGQHFGEGNFIGVYNSHLRHKNLLYLEGVQRIGELDRRLVEIFGSHIGVAFDNQSMYQEMELTQSELVYRLGEAVESSSLETGHHVKRMALTSRVLAEKIGLSGHDVDLIFKAAPLHDVGKIAIPHRILNKPGKLDDQEWEIMKSHAQKGYDILASSQLEVLRAGAQIALCHHENWDGSGYPNGLTGDNIPVMGRIAAVADVWDALINRRCYKQPWPMEKVLGFFDEMRGCKFDPRLVDVLHANLEELMAIQEAFSDEE